MFIQAVSSFAAYKRNNVNVVRTPQQTFTSCCDKDCLKTQISDLRVFNHNIYEYKKGLRRLILTTEKGQYQDVIENRLQNEKIPYLINPVGNGKINVFFGDERCVKVAETLNPKLNLLSPEQDFILGIMLGYDRVMQCERYLKFKDKEINRTDSMI